MHCKNCEIPLVRESDYCHNCGAKVIRNRLTIKNLFQHFTETFFNYDNTFLQTFIRLFTKPEEVIGCYIHGTRKKYVNVISYFALAITASGLHVFILNKFFPEVMDIGFMSRDGLEDMQRENMNFAQEYQSILYMLLVPVYALISRIVFINYKVYNYTEHIVINMYTSAHMAIVTSVFVIILSFFHVSFAVSGLLAIPIQIIYTAYVFKRLLKLSLGNLILKTLLFLVILSILFVIFSITITAIMYLSGDLNAVIEAQKAAKGT